MNASNTSNGWLGNYKQMAEYAGCSQRTVCRWISDGRLQVRRLSSRKVMCRPSDMDKCIQNLADSYEMGVGL